MIEKLSANTVVRLAVPDRHIRLRTVGPTGGYSGACMDDSLLKGKFCSEMEQSPAGSLSHQQVHGANYQKRFYVLCNLHMGMGTIAGKSQLTSLTDRFSKNTFRDA